MVAGAGLEPATFGLWARRATNCSTPRYLVGGIGFEPMKAKPADLQSAPFNHSGIRPYGAGNRTWTYDLLITNQLLYQLSYASTQVTKYIIHNSIHLVKNFFRSLLLTQRFVLITFIDYSIIAPLCLPLFYNFFEKGPEKFPATMLYHYLMSDGKPFANSFLPLWYAIVPCRTGNYTQTVSCRNDSQSSHAE